MSLKMAFLLIHSAAVPLEAREAFARALEGPPEAHEAECAEAARILCHQTELECNEVRDLTGHGCEDC